MTSDAEMPAVLYPVNLLQAAREAEKTTLCEPQWQGVSTPRYHPAHWLKTKEGGFLKRRRRSSPKPRCWDAGSGWAKRGLKGY